MSNIFQCFLTEIPTRREYKKIINEVTLKF